MDQEKCPLCGSSELHADYADLIGLGEQRISEWTCLTCGAIQFNGAWHGREQLEEDDR